MSKRRPTIRRLKGWSRLLLGSVAEKIARKATIPVLTVRNPTEFRKTAAHRESDCSIGVLIHFPFCSNCEIVLDQTLNLTLNPRSNSNEPCEHLVWLDGQFAEFEQFNRVNRVIGSTVFCWVHPILQDLADDDDLRAYLTELSTNDGNWEYAPMQPFEINPIVLDQKTKNKDGNAHLEWRFDVKAIFAQAAIGVAEELPACRDQHLSALADK